MSELQRVRNRIIYKLTLLNKLTKLSYMANISFNRIIYTLLTICLTGFLNYSYAGNYSVKKGSSIKVNCTATAPAGGWITHAFFSLVNPEDQEYLGLSYTSSDLQATFYGLKTRSNIKVEITYAYSYRGSYDGDIHVGHGSYYDYISVTGAPEASNIKIREGSPIDLRPGASKTLHIDFIPSGSEGYVNWGFIQSLGQPFNFKLEVANDGKSAVITAKNTGSVYLMAMLNNDQKKSDIITVNCKKDAVVETPKSLEILPSTVTLKTGEVKKLTTSFTPSSAWAELMWSSENDKIASVDENGEITAISTGTTTINAKTADGNIFAKATVIVKQNFTGFALPSSATINLGFTYTVNPDIYPADALYDLTWSSSDISVATVSAAGIITAKNEGTCTITAKSKILNRDSSIQITVKRPSTTNMDHRNLRQRIQVVKSLVTRSVINK